MHFLSNLRCLGIAIFAAVILAAGHSANAQGANDPKLLSDPDLQFKVSKAVLEGRCNDAKTLALLGGRLDLADQAMRLCVPTTQTLNGSKPEVAPPALSTVNKPTDSDLGASKTLLSQAISPVNQSSSQTNKIIKEDDIIAAAETKCMSLAQDSAYSNKGFFGMPKIKTVKPAKGCIVLYTDLFRRNIQIASEPNPDQIFIEKPEWLRAPKGSDYATFYPKGASKAGAWGSVQMRCIVTVNGDLEKCAIQYESPIGAGFGEASQQMAMNNWKMKPKIVENKPIEASWQTVINWILLED
jgi:hypothetical protein